MTIPQEVTRFLLRPRTHQFVDVRSGPGHTNSGNSQIINAKISYHILSLVINSDEDDWAGGRD